MRIIRKRITDTVTVCMNGNGKIEMALKKKRKLGAYAMKPVTAGAHLLTPWFFEPAKRPDDRAVYYLGIERLFKTSPQNGKYTFAHIMKACVRMGDKLLTSDLIMFNILRILACPLVSEELRRCESEMKKSALLTRRG